MSFIKWHYSEGVEYYWQAYKFSVNSVVHYFSLPLLLKTLFSPWKRLSVKDNKPGFNLDRYFDVISFNLVSRMVGAMVRIVLFLAGNLAVFFLVVLGLLGLLFWLLIPPLSYGVYARSGKTAEAFIKSLIENNSRSIISTFLVSENGQFYVRHLGVRPETLTGAMLKEVEITSAKSIRDIIRQSIAQGVWNENVLRQSGLVLHDLEVAAHWLDKHTFQFTEMKPESYGTQGIGMSMLYGYTPKLDTYSIDILSQVPKHQLVGRKGIVSQLERILTSGSSVVLVGRPGVGKKTVVKEFAKRASFGEFGQDMSYRRILELDYNFLFSEISDLNLKKTTLSEVLSEAASAGNVILVVRDIHRLVSPEVEGVDFTDVLEPYLEKRELKIIAISETGDFERYLSKNLRIIKYLQPVTVEQPNLEEVLHILVMYSQELEEKHGITILVQAVRTIIENTDNYITEIPFPEKAIVVLDSVASYVVQRGKATLTVDDVNRVLSERTGIDFNKLTSSHKKKLSEIESIIHERLVNQETAVGLIGRILRAKTVGVISTNRPIGSLLFLGPTGVGKTQTAKVLADVYYGSQNEIVRFDMAEYAGQEGLERLIGSASRNTSGTLTGALRTKPSSLLLFDEIEKVSPQIFNLLLSLLDEGVITDAFNRKVSAKNAFVIATSNAAAVPVHRLVNQGIKGEELQSRVVGHVISEGHFSPEFINRFDGVVVYEPLTKDHLVEIARLELAELEKNLKSKNIYISAARETLEKIAAEGYKPEFGARPMRRILELYIGDMLGKAMLSGELAPGDTIEIAPAFGTNQYTWRKINQYTP